MTISVKLVVREGLTVSAKAVTLEVPDVEESVVD